MILKSGSSAVTVIITLLPPPRGSARIVNVFDGRLPSESSTVNALKVEISGVFNSNVASK